MLEFSISIKPSHLIPPCLIAPKQQLGAASAQSVKKFSMAQRLKEALPACRCQDMQHKTSPAVKVAASQMERIKWAEAQHTFSKKPEGADAWLEREPGGY